MKIAITGATGFIGSRVVKILRARGDDVVCIARTPSKATDLTALGCTVVKGDILDKASLAAAFAGCDAVIHMAASYEIGLTGEKKKQAGQFNLDGTRNALEAAHEAGAKKIVYTSSLVVYGYARKDPPIKEGDATSTEHPSFYGESKAQAHDIALALIKTGAPIVIVQPGAVLGPRDHSSMRFIFGALARGLPLPIGDAVYGMIDVDECARGHVAALDKGVAGHCYHFAAEFMTMDALMERAHQLTGVPNRAITLPTWLLRMNAFFTSIVEIAVPMPELLSSELARTMSGVFQNMDRSNSVTELGFEPRSIDTIVKEIVKDDLTRLGKPIPKQLSA
jgi:dihydroflavonol-4-reductase